MKRAMSRVKLLLDLVKFEHTIFALPFALISAMLAARHLHSPISWVKLSWILLAMVGARSAAMAFNRIVDADIDAQNPRTSGRHIPAGLVTRLQAGAFLAGAVFLFELAARALNPLCFALSPLALLAILGYSFTKRFTWLCHLALGAAIGIAPIGAWIAITGRLDVAPLLLGLAVTLWIGGFDIIYATQDFEFDRGSAVFSLPKRVGIAEALAVSRIMHLLLVGALILTGLREGLHELYFAGVFIAALLIAWEQSLVRPTDLRRVNVAFFTLNGWVSVSLFIFVLLDLAIRH